MFVAAVTVKRFKLAIAPVGVTIVVVQHVRTVPAITRIGRAYSVGQVMGDYATCRTKGLAAKELGTCTQSSRYQGFLSSLIGTFCSQMMCSARRIRRGHRQSGCSSCSFPQSAFMVL